MPVSWANKKARAKVIGACQCCKPIIRASKRGKDRRLFCSTSCGIKAAHLVKREARALERISACPMPYPTHVRREVMGLMRIARYKPNRAKAYRVKCPTCEATYIHAQDRRDSPIDCRPCARRKANYKAKAAGSKAAYRLRAKVIRRARMGIDADAINPYVILCRDKWTCQICGIPTPRTLRGSYEPNAPEVDHVIPLAMGGSHIEGNLQCACRACNLRRAPGGLIRQKGPSRLQSRPQSS